MVFYTGLGTALQCRVGKSSLKQYASTKEGESLAIITQADILNCTVELSTLLKQK